MTSLRHEDLVRSPLPDPTATRLHDLNRALSLAVARLAQDLYGTQHRGARELIALAAIDLPYGAIRRHLSPGAPPEDLRAHVERAIRAVLRGSPTPPRTESR